MTTQSLVASKLPGLRELSGAADDYDDLLDQIGDARVVLLGGSSHGTHEFQRERARITQRLIDERGFTAIGLVADWPDTYRLGRYALGQTHDQSATEALDGFARFPNWLWRNADMAAFTEWLRARNDSQSSPATKATFYSLDLFNAHRSMADVLSYLGDVDSKAATAARSRYGCCDHAGGVPEQYGKAVAFQLNVACENEIVAQLKASQNMMATAIMNDEWDSVSKHFYAERSAQIKEQAEQYYRQIYLGGVAAWNLRDQQMSETLTALVEFLDQRLGETKVVVWGHNSHVGDARATALGATGQLSIGQFVRDAWPNNSVRVGFTTYEGTVTAANEWGGSMRQMSVLPGLADGYEATFHDLPQENFIIDLRAADWLPEVAPQRGIGVVYWPETEQQSHWFDAHLRDQFDAVIHLDTTRAVEPLDHSVTWDLG